MYEIKIAEPVLSSNIIPKLKRILHSGNLAQGKWVEKIEKNLAEYLNASFCVAVSSGTAALHAALSILNIGPGDEVITTPFTFISTASAILMVGAKPVFVDIEYDSFLIDPTQIEGKISKRTKAIIAVDLFGQMADYQKISSFAKKNGIFVIEDACQALGSRQKRKPIGSLADIATLSFYATKPLTAGEGGAIITNSKKFAKKAKSFRNIGRNLKNPELFNILGFNYRMTEFQAVILLSQLPKFEENLVQRRKNANFLTSNLSKIPGIETPTVENENQHTFSQYTIKVKKPYPLNHNQLKKKFDKAKIETKIYYPLPLHLQPLFANLGYQKGDFPNAEQTANQTLSLPIHPLVSKKDLNRIVKIIKVGSTIAST